MDLLDRAKELINQGNPQTNSQMAYLQTLQQASTQKAEVKTKVPSNSQNNNKNTNFNALYLVGGLVLLIPSVLAIGY
jgi:hypothetical protein